MASTCVPNCLSSLRYRVWYFAGRVREFMLLNYLATLKITKKHDKRNKNDPAKFRVMDLLQSCTMADARKLGV